MATLITLERLNLSIKNISNSLSSLASKMPTKISQLENDADYMTTATTNNLIANETARAQAAEKDNADKIAAEVTRATKAESSLAADIAEEKNRATVAEGDLEDKITAEIEKTTSAISTLQTSVNKNTSDIANINSELDGVADALSKI